MKRLVSLAVAVLMGVLLSAGLASAAEFKVGPFIEWWSWKDRMSSTFGNATIKEDDVMYGIEASVQGNPGSDLVLRGNGKLFFGSPDADASANTFFGSGTATVGTQYWGYRLEGDVGLKFKADEMTILTPFVGFGWRQWQRSFKDDVNIDNDWNTFYTKIGIRGSAQTSKSVNISSEFGMLVPLYKKSKFSGNDWSESYKPGTKVSAFADLGLKYNQFSANVYYEAYRFGYFTITDGVDSFSIKSNNDIFGLRLGYSF